MSALDEATPAWEQCKENVAPLRRGRNVNQLAKAFGSMAALETGPVDVVSGYEADISAAAAGANALEPWLKYIRHLEDDCVSDGAKAFEARERCARLFKDSEQYRNDARYICVWLGYAAQLEKAEEAFRYLHKKKIGEEVHEFWAAWALDAERSGKRKLASDLYDKGVSKCAETGLLERKRSDFEARIARRIAADLAAGADAAPRPAARPALAAQPVRRRAQPAAPNENGADPTAAPRWPAPAPSAVPSAAPPAAAPTGPAATSAGFIVFVDDEPDKPVPVLLDTAVDDWPDFGSRAQRVKENSAEPARWTDSALGNKLGAAPKTSAAAIAIFDDADGFDDATAHSLT
ncbi:Mad3/BUB1 homology region 1-domain-containing protein [Pelagophyceae sp. CCMP2097]|nr:Mad3/BUB1 homology region 1-domain-containing protein [Pelagophyceae sp. CCMP2097]